MQVHGSQGNTPSSSYRCNNKIKNVLSHTVIHLTLLPQSFYYSILTSYTSSPKCNSFRGSQQHPPSTSSPCPSAARTAERFPINAPPNFRVPNIRHYRPVLPFPDLLPSTEEYHIHLVNCYLYKLKGFYTNIHILVYICIYI